MVRIAKRPLKMANGVIVRTIEDLKNNFDIEIVVGYFLDGNLSKWLETRGYKEELEQVGNLTENDTELAKKLCDIFGVECIGNIEIDTEDIIERKERLLKLKQYTDDEEIIANVDSVAFNQEELADLYDKGVEKIYLCEGYFKIPKSKKDLVYHLVGDVIVDGLEADPIKEDSQNNHYEDTNAIESTIPVSLADYIGYNTYAKLNNYVIWSEDLSSYLLNNKIKPFFENKKTKNFEVTDRHKIWNIDSDEYSSLYSYDLSEAQKFYACGNKLVYLRYQDLYVYDVDSKTQKILYKKLSYLNNEISISDNKIAFYEDSGNIVVLDINKSQKIFSKELYHDGRYTLGSNAFCLSGNYLFCEENKKIMQYNLDNNKSTVIYEFNVPEEYKEYEKYSGYIFTDKIIYFNNSLYVFYWDRCEMQSKVLKIDLQTNTHTFCNISDDNWFNFYEDNSSSSRSRYVVFFNKKKIHVYDMLFDELKSYSDSFPSKTTQINRVGDYLYWGFHKDKPSYRVDLNKGWNPESLSEEVLTPEAMLGKIRFFKGGIC